MTEILLIVTAAKNPQSIDIQGFFSVERVVTAIFGFVSKFLEVVLAIGSIWKLAKMVTAHCHKRVFFGVFGHSLSPLIFLCFL